MTKKKIFISYSRAEGDYVSRLVDALRSKGFDVWFDKHIRTGNEWDNTIEREIKNADAMVLILSNTSVQSNNVKDEMSYAMQLSKSVIPIKIEECDVPMRLARKQFIDFTQVGFDQGVIRLVDDISHALALPSNVAETKPVTPPETKPIKPEPQTPVTTPKEPVSVTSKASAPKKSSGSNKALIYIIGAAVLAAAIWGITSLTSGNEEADMMAMCKADWEHLKVEETTVEEISQLEALRNHIELYAPCPHEEEAMDKISFLTAMGVDENIELAEESTDNTDNSASSSNTGAAGNQDGLSNGNNPNGSQEAPSEIVEEVIDDVEVNGMNVAFVRYHGGVFFQKSPKVWIEVSENGERLFMVGKRDLDAVYLREGNDVKIILNISENNIIYSDSNTEPFVLYSITETSIELP